MKKITLTKAWHLLRRAECALMQVGKTQRTIPVFLFLSSLSGRDENEFLHIYWTENRTEYSMKFSEETNREVEISGDGSMILRDTDSESEVDYILLTLMRPWDLSKEI